MKRQIPDPFVRRIDHVVWKIVEGKGILLNLDNGAYFDTDAVGLAIWEKCDGKTRFSEIAKSVGLKFQTDPEKVSRDVFQFIRELRRQRLVETLSVPSRAIARS